MAPKSSDNSYMRLQFLLRVLRSDGVAFQQFVNDILAENYSNFARVKAPDGGNDGYRKGEGVYYQVHAPEQPHLKRRDVAKKLKQDFSTLMERWDQIEQLKAFNFVLNDKGHGTFPELEQAVSDLRAMHSEIEFNVLLADDIEREFDKLSPNSLRKLGFDAQSAHSVDHAQRYLDAVSIQLDRGNDRYAEQALLGCEGIVAALADNGLSLRFATLRCRALGSRENLPNELNCLQALRRNFPRDPEPLLQLSEWYLRVDDFDNNAKVLAEANRIDSEHENLGLQQLLRDARMGKIWTADQIHEISVPADLLLRSRYYRLFAVHLAEGGDLDNALAYVNDAIACNQNSLQNLMVRFALKIAKVTSLSIDRDTLQGQVQELRAEMDSIECTSANWGASGPRHLASMSFNRYRIAELSEAHDEMAEYAKLALDALLRCAYDHSVDGMITALTLSVRWSNVEFNHLLEYLRLPTSKVKSSELAEALFLQFMHRGTLLTDGRSYFDDWPDHGLGALFDALERDQPSEVWNLIKDRLVFAVRVAASAKQFPESRRYIIDQLPDDKRIRKDLLQLLFNYEENLAPRAYDIASTVDLTQLSYGQLRLVLDVAREQKAWELVDSVIGRLLTYDRDPQIVTDLQLERFAALVELGKFAEVASLGEHLLASSSSLEHIKSANREALLAQTIKARLRRNEIGSARALLEAHKDKAFSGAFRLAVEAEVLLRTNEPQAALKAVLTALRSEGRPSPEQYASTYYLIVRIGNLMELPQGSDEQVGPNRFVKVRDQERWYFIGEEGELDATRVASGHPLYGAFRGKRLGEHVKVPGSYRSQQNPVVIEQIFSPEAYICWQAHFQVSQLSQEHRLEGVESVEITSTDGKIDTQFLAARIEDEQRKTEQAFDAYCKGRMPLAVLACVEGGLIGAVARITNENRGYVDCCAGDMVTWHRSSEQAASLLGGAPCVLDGTTAVVLSESGLLPEIHKHLAGLLVPQSVLTLLMDLRDHFHVVPGHTGFLRMVRGKLDFVVIDPAHGRNIQERIQASIDLLESHPDKLRAISSGGKSDHATEQKVPAYLVDACVIAQKEGGVVLTEDYRFLQFHEKDTGKRAPRHCAAIFLARALRDKHVITFDRYLEFFYFLTTYRFRFLQITSDELWHAVFGTKRITVVRPTHLRAFNFQLTLSPDYGVPYDKAFQFVAQFMLRVLLDNSILAPDTIKIFAEVITQLPSQLKRQALGRLLIDACTEAITAPPRAGAPSRQLQAKLDALLAFNAAFEEGAVQLP